MSEGPPSSLTPRGLPAEKVAARRGRRIAVGVVIALLAAIGIGELTLGLVSRAIDATGWTCGSGWSRVGEDDLAGARIIRWGTPEAREQSLDPADFTDLPPGLAEPTLTTAAFPAEGDYDPLLYPLGGGIVLQSTGFYEQTWVAADAETGEPLWGVAAGSMGISTVQGRLALLAERDDGRTDLTTLDPRTGERLSCIRLEGDVLGIAGVGAGDLVVALDATGADGDDRSRYRLVRVAPEAGEAIWSEPIEAYPAGLHAEGDLVVVSSSQVGAVTTRWVSSGSGGSVLGVDAKTGQVVWHHEPASGQVAVVGLAPLPDGGTGTLALTVADEDAWYERRGEYALLDPSGEPLWSVPASYGDEVASWAAGETVVVLEDTTLVGFDGATGERRWESDVAAAEDDVALLDTGAGEVLVLTDQRVEGEGSGARFVTRVLDPRTGALTVHEAPLRSFQVTDTYVLAGTGLTQIVITRTPTP